MTANTFYHFDGDPADETAWQRFIAEHRVPSAGEQQPVTTSATAVKQLTELFLLFVVVVALVGTVLRQQNIRQVEALKLEVERLQAELAAAVDVPKAAGLAVNAMNEEKTPPVLHVIETEFFRFYVEAGYMDAVTHVVSTVDEEYRQLSMDLGLAIIAEGDKQPVYVADMSEPYKANLPTLFGVIGIDMAPATRQTTHNPVAQVQLIHDSLFGQTIQTIVAQMVSSRTIKPQWNALVGHLAANLTQPQLPKSVDELRPEELQNRQFAQRLSPHQAKLTYEPGNWMYPEYNLANTVADSLGEYILVTYGRAVVPPLLDTLSEYQEWEEVVVAVFNISPEQFKAEWHAYLQEHYPIDPAQPY